MSLRSLYKPTVCLDCANGVGAIAMLELVKYLQDADIKFELFNDGSHGKLNHMVCVYVIYFIM